MAPPRSPEDSLSFNRSSSSFTGLVIDLEEESDDMNGRNGDAVNLCSKTSSEMASSDDGQDDSDILDRIQEIGKSLNDNLNKLGRRLKKRKGKLKEPGKPKRTKKLTMVSSEDSTGQEESLGKPFNDSGSCGVADIIVVETERERELKRMLEVVTLELGRSRTEKIKKGRREKAKDKETIYFDVLEDKDYYEVKKDWIMTKEKPEEWFSRFNNHPKLKITPAYNEWIQNRINDFLPEVLRIISDWKDSFTSGQQLQLTGSDLLVCRLVSKSWKCTVDKFLQEISLAQDDVNSSNHNPLAISTKLCFKNRTKFLDMVKCGLPSTLNPFPSRALVIRYVPWKDDQESNDVRELVNRFLLKYGEHIYSFTYDDDAHLNSNRCIKNRWSSLGRYLMKMSNLKALKLSFPPMAPTDFYAIQCLEKGLGRFPSFPNLQIIDFQHVPNSLTDSMLVANPHIKKLSILPITAAEGDPDPRLYRLHKLNYHPLNMLSSLSLHVVFLKQLYSLEIVQWPLTKLSLFSGVKWSKPIHLEEIFQTLKKFDGTLTVLNLDMCVFYPKDIILSLELSRLQNLSLYLRQYLPGRRISYDFMLPLTTLQTLKIIMERNYVIGNSEGEGDDVMVIQLKGYVDRLYDSNVWKLFPLLKMVDLTAHLGVDVPPKLFKYSRDMLPSAYM